MGWGNSKYYKEDGKKIMENPEPVRENFKGEFICGPDFTVFNCEEKEIEVIGRRDIFRKGKY